MEEQDALRDCDRETHGTRQEILAILIFFLLYTTTDTIPPHHANTTAS